MSLNLEELLVLSDQELGLLDIAEVNRACAQGLPCLESVDENSNRKKLDSWAEQIRRETKRLYSRYEARPAEFQNSKSRFRIAAMVTVLQRELEIRYDPELMQRDDFFKDPANTFLDGVVGSLRGTCTNLPVLYVAVGRRLGYPLRLVSTKCHMFARWDSPQDRFNIECTSLGFVSHDDQHYLAWPMPTTSAELHDFALLKSKTPREELACFMAARGHCLLDNLMYKQAGEAYAWAFELQPQCRLHLSSMEASTNRWRSRLRQKWEDRPFPQVTMQIRGRRFSKVPLAQEADWAYMAKLEDWVDSALKATSCVV